jgi:hypothetical protein
VADGERMRKCSFYCPTYCGRLFFTYFCSIPYNTKADSVISNKAPEVVEQTLRKKLRIPAHNEHY